MLLYQQASSSHEIVNYFIVFINFKYKISIITKIYSHEPITFFNSIYLEALPLIKLEHSPSACSISPAFFTSIAKRNESILERMLSIKEPIKNQEDFDA